MKEYLNGYSDLPFPTGLTSSYVEASGTDEDGECFIIYDAECGDLTTSYGEQLTDAGFEFDDEFSGDDYFNYYYDIEGTNDSIGVQIYYEEGEFDLFAWYYQGDAVYATFPYELIADFLDKDSVDETIVPSFELAEGEGYGAYASGTEYLMVYGYYDETIDEDTYTASYETKLTNAGYTVDSENWIAINETNGIQIEYGAFYGIFTISIEKYVVVVPPEAGDHTTTFTGDDFSAYAELDFVKDGIRYSGDSIMKSAEGEIQFRNVNKGAGNIYNTTSMGEITSIVITRSTQKDVKFNGALSCYVSSSVISETNAGTVITPTLSDGVYTYTIPVGNSYFKLIDETQYASYNSSIVINFTIA